MIIYSHTNVAEVVHSVFKNAFDFQNNYLLIKRTKLR